ANHLFGTRCELTSGRIHRASNGSDHSSRGPTLKCRFRRPISTFRAFDRRLILIGADGGSNDPAATPNPASSCAPAPPNLSPPPCALHPPPRLCARLTSIQRTINQKNKIMLKNFYRDFPAGGGAVGLVSGSNILQRQSKVKEHHNIKDGVCAEGERACFASR